MDNNFDYATGYQNLTPDQINAASAGMGMVFGGMLVFGLVAGLVFYILMALALYKICLKTGRNKEHAWFAWVPFLNIILMLNVAGFSGWTMLLFFIPLVNIIFAIYVWMKISQACGKPDFLGLLMLVPIANFILPLYLAFSEEIKTSE